MSAFARAFAQFFTFITTMFGVLEKVAISADNLATVGVEASGGYMDQARMDRAVNRRKMELEHKIKVADLEVLEAQPITPKAKATKPALAA